MIDDKRLIGIIEEYRSQAEGSDFSADQLSQERELALDYYYGRPRAGVPALSEYEGSSSVKHTLVHDYVNAVIAQMVPSLANDNPCSFERITPDDESAESESKAVNQALMEDNRGFEILMAGAKSAALFKNAFAKVWCEEYETTTTRSYSSADDEEQALLDGEEGFSVSNGRATRQTQGKRLKVELVDPANFSYQANWDKLDFQDITYCEEVCEYTRSELLEMGYPADKVKDLKPGHEMTRTEHISRNLDKRDASAETAFTYDQEPITVYETYLRIAMDEGAQGELWRIVHAERTVLEKQTVELVPYCTGVLYAALFRCAGESLAEKLRELQDQATGLTRDLMDMTRQNAAGGLVLNEQINEADIGDRAIGADIRCDGDVRTAAMPLPVVDMSGGILMAIEKAEQLASKRAGASLDLQSGEVQGLEKVTNAGAVATTQMIGHQELQASMLTRTFAETFVRNLYSLIHETMRREYDQPIVVVQNGVAQQVDPRQWPERTRINVKTGMSPNERNRKIASLGQVLQFEMAAMQAGLPIANPKTLHAVLSDYMKAADLDSGDRYFVDPMSPEYAEVEQMQQQMSQQQAQQAMQMETIGEQVKLQIAQMDNQMKKYVEELKATVQLEIAEASNATTIGTAEISARQAEISSQGAGQQDSQSGNGRAN